MAADATADAVVVSGLAPTSTIEKAIAEAKKVGIYSIIDMLNGQNPAKLIEKLKVKPDIVELHRAIDTEDTAHAWGDIAAMKKAAGGKLLVATAGGTPGRCHQGRSQGWCGYSCGWSGYYGKQGHRACDR